MKSKPITRAPAPASRSTSGTYSLRGHAGGPKRCDALLVDRRRSRSAGSASPLRAGTARNPSIARSGRRITGMRSAATRKTTRAPPPPRVSIRRMRRRAITPRSKRWLASTLMAIRAPILAHRVATHHRPEFDHRSLLRRRSGEKVAEIGYLPPAVVFFEDTRLVTQPGHVEPGANGGGGRCGARVTFYPTGDGYELGAVPSVEKFLTSVPALKKAGIPVRGFEPRSRG